MFQKRPVFLKKRNSCRSRQKCHETGRKTGRPSAHQNPKLWPSLTHSSTRVFSGYISDPVGGAWTTSGAAEPGGDGAKERDLFDEDHHVSTPAAFLRHKNPVDAANGMR